MNYLDIDASLTRSETEASELALVPSILLSPEFCCPVNSRPRMHTIG